jgi:hypothetical protein
MNSIFLLFFLFPPAPASMPAKISVDEVVAGHLASLGTPEARAAVKTRFAQGKVQMKIIVGGQGNAEGRAYLFGEGRKFRAALPFDFADYWGEHFFSDGDKAVVGFSQPTIRSSLGSFLDRYNSILKEGLAGGVLSTAWPLLDREGRQPKLEYNGLKKVDGKEVHQITYHMKKGQGEEMVTLFFEADTFRHVKSVYDVTLQSRMTGISGSSKQQEGHYSVEEMFGDFAPVDGVTLPTHWTIRSTVNRDRTTVREWYAVFEKIVHNEPIDPKNFIIDQAPK